jgi:hypothetical protein
MPTNRHGRVKHMLRRGEAVVVRRTPFTVRLTRPGTEFTQDVTLGVDAGSKTIGLSASTEQEELFAAELKPRNDVKKLLSARRMYRRSRRGRTTRHRPARFKNRIRSKHRGWLAPSVEVKIHNHIQGIKLVCKILPISKIIIETAEFDLQRLKAMEEGKPLPVGTDYRLGEQYDFYNVRQYVLFRDGYKCRICGAKDVKLHNHHLESRMTGGDSPNNQATLCTDCHKKGHKGIIDLKTLKRGKSFRDAGFMGIMRPTLMRRVRDMFPDIPVTETKGFITKYVRESEHMDKSHINDALCITGHPKAKRAETRYLVKPVRSRNRRIHKAKFTKLTPGILKKLSKKGKALARKKGYRKIHQGPKEMLGFTIFDRVLMPDGREGFIFGRRVNGYFDIRTLGGERLSKGVDCKKLIPLDKRKSILVQAV